MDCFEIIKLLTQCMFLLSLLCDSDQMIEGIDCCLLGLIEIYCITQPSLVYLHVYILYKVAIILHRYSTVSGV